MPDFMTLLSKCIENLGTSDFYPPFIDIVIKIIKADQCMIFSYDNIGVKCYLSVNAKTNDKGKFLAEQYISFGFKSDPLFSRILELKENEIEIWPLEKLKPSMPKNYLDKFFLKPDLKNKISILTNNQGQKLCLSFYGDIETDETSEFDNSIWHLLCALVSRHYASGERALLQSPLASLSERERNICNGILRGLTTEAIACELNIQPNTVTTYRKRAYSKLGINSKTALFVLCGNRV